MSEYLGLFLKAILISLIMACLWVGWFEVNPMQYIMGTTRKGQRGKHRFIMRYINISQRIYSKFSRFIFAQNLCHSLKISWALSEDEAKVWAGRTILVEIITIIVTFFISLYILNSALLSVILTYMISILVLYRIKGNELKFIEELYKQLDEMVYMYSAQRGNIDRMFEKILSKRTYMTPYMEQMFEYLQRATLENDNKARTEYKNVAASRYLCLVFNYLYIAKIKGDTEELFVTNMSKLQREIHAEYTKTKQINDSVSIEVFMVVLPVILIYACEQYMKMNFTFQGFEFINRILSGSSGYTIKVICALVALICFYLYIALLYTSNTILENKELLSWEELFILKNKKINRFLIKIQDKDSFFLNQIISKLQLFDRGRVNLKTFYFKSFVVGGIALVGVTMIVIGDNLYQYLVLQNNIYVGVDKQLMDLAIDTEPDKEEFTKRSIENDRVLIRDFKKNGFIEVAERIESLGLNYGVYQEVAISRVMEKWNLMNQFNYITLAIVILSITSLGLCLPFINLLLNVLLKRKAILNEEVVGLYTVTILLIHHPSANKDMLIDWLTQFSTTFKSRFQNCADHFTEETIAQLDREIDYPPLNRLVEGLRLTQYGLHISDAFAGIEQRHKFQEESRDLINKRVIQVRTDIAGALSWISLGTTFIFYIMLPLLYMIMDMMAQVN